MGMQTDPIKEISSIESYQSLKDTFELNKFELKKLKSVKNGLIKQNFSIFNKISNFINKLESNLKKLDKFNIQIPTIKLKRNEETSNIVFNDYQSIIKFYKLVEKTSYDEETIKSANKKRIQLMNDIISRIEESIS